VIIDEFLELFLIDMQGMNNDNIPASQPASLMFVRIAAVISPARYIAKLRRMVSFHCSKMIFAI
jgi:hypothetical protein